MYELMHWLAWARLHKWNDENPSFSQPDQFMEYPKAPCEATKQKIEGNVVHLGC
jgi:hypothetical protein